LIAGVARFAVPGFSRFYDAWAGILAQRGILSGRREKKASPGVEISRGFVGKKIAPSKRWLALAFSSGDAALIAGEKVNKNLYVYSIHG